MIEIDNKKILFWHTCFLIIIGIICYELFNTFFQLKNSPSFLFIYLAIWITFALINIFLINFFVLPSKIHLNKLLKKTLHNEKTKELFSQLKVENLKYKTLFDSIHDPICIFDRDQIILSSNQAYNSLFSIDNKELSPTSLIEISRNLEFQELVTQAIVSNQPVKLHDFTFGQFQDPQKSFYDIDIFFSENAQAYICLMRNATERKITGQIREDFISNISHEMRTPLTILHGQLQNLKNSLQEKNELNNNFKIIFDKIDNNNKRLINLFNDLLRLASVEKKKDLQKENIDIEPMVHMLTDELKNNYPNKKITFVIQLETLLFFVDYNLFEQVMINLIDNAIKYTLDQGEIAIRSYEDSSSTTIEISDSGIGIPEEQIHRIFERFFRVDSSHSNSIEGTGLGLSIVKHIVQKHEGKIKVKSSIGKGTTISVILPKSLTVG